MRYLRTLIGVLAFAVFMLASEAQARMDIHEGLWEFSVGYQLPGAYQNYPQYTIRQCMTADDPIPRFTLQNQDCQSTLYRNINGSVTWQMTCTNDTEMVQGMGHVSYWEDEFYGTVNLQIMGPYHVHQQPMYYTLYGQYVGPCKDE